MQSEQAVLTALILSSAALVLILRYVDHWYKYELSVAHSQPFDALTDLRQNIVLFDGHPNLDPRINCLIEKSEEDGGIFLKDIPEKHVVKAYTLSGSTYEVAVIDEENGEAAVRGGSYFPTAENVFIHGSTWGGSMVKIRWIGINMRFEFISASQGLVSTSPVVRIIVEDDPELWDQLVNYAREHGPRFVTVEELELGVQKFIETHFSDAELKMATQIVSNFSPNGKVAISSLLATAFDHGKFSECVLIIERLWSEHWMYQAPEVCGDPNFTPQNLYYLERAYAELELPLPSSSQ